MINLSNMKIVSKAVLCDVDGIRITKMEILSADLARKVKPGQFVVIMTCEEGERIPLTIVDRDVDRGIVTIIFQEAGFTTKLLGRMSPGDFLYALVGPLGHATDIKKYGKVIIIGGGVGIAEIYPVAKAFKEAGNHVTTILGSRTKKLLILEDELRSVSDDFHVTTDDGSYARKGFTTDVLKELLSKDRYELIYAVGPVPMMKRVALISKDSGVRTVVSLNALMVDATGMCGCCRVTVGGAVRFSCVDGPEFDAHNVDWDELIKRNNIYSSKEKHICNLNKHP